MKNLGKTGVILAFRLALMAALGTGWASAARAETAQPVEAPQPAETTEAKTPPDLKLSPLHRAAYQNNTIELRNWLEKGADVNVQADNGNTPLHVAAYEGHTESIAFLLAHGADPNLLDKKGRTALDLAIRHHKQAIVKILTPLTAAPSVASFAEEPEEKKP